MTWWISQSANRTVQPGWAQVRYIARNARRCSRVASRCSRPTSRSTPAPFNTTGIRLASQHRRRTVVRRQRLAVAGLTDAVVVEPGAQGVQSMSTETSGTRRSVVRAPVTNADHGVGLQLIETPLLVVGLGLFGGDRRIQGGRHTGVGLRVQLQMGVAHPGVPVDPPPQGRVAGATVHGSRPRHRATGSGPGPASPVRTPRHWRSSPTRPGSPPTLGAGTGRRHPGRGRPGPRRRHAPPTPRRPPRRHAPRAAGHTPRPA